MGQPILDRSGAGVPGADGLMIRRITTNDRVPPGCAVVFVHDGSADGDPGHAWTAFHQTAKLWKEMLDPASPSHPLSRTVVRPWQFYIMNADLTHHGSWLPQLRWDDLPAIFFSTGEHRIFRCSRELTVTTSRLFDFTLNFQEAANHPTAGLGAYVSWDETTIRPSSARQCRPATETPPRPSAPRRCATPGTR